MSDSTLNKPTAVLCIHGSLSSSRQWAMLSQQLPASYNAITPDLTGYGQSEFPANPKQYDLDFELDQLIANGLPEKFHLIGHSFGGAVAIGLALRYPQRVLSMSLFEPMAIWLLDEQHPGRVDSRTMMDLMAKRIAEGNTLNAAEMFIQYWNHCPTSKALAPSLARTLDVPQVKYPLDNRAACTHHATLNDLRQLTMPIQLIGTPESPLLASAIIELLADTFSNCSKAQVTGGHLAPVTRPGLVNPLLIDFIEQNSVIKKDQQLDCQSPQADRNDRGRVQDQPDLLAFA
ncbi:alpha/beta fold hydrolase [Pelagibaculum spongiae]|uniref:AB hydrolase-1 domain-containing protein n=1 Tax=Pelagibaculum spongiae TaxID=2080658 RepID=A0A2V1GWP7_9GAMM|nr:alpha/beta hydrolase [Pelagibaculum spongiae]PVZ69478.1 hypothetical protein DC094_09070 [Pelagibaculum spongiae]